MIDLQLLEENKNLQLFDSFLSGSIETEKFLLTKDHKGRYKLQNKTFHIGNTYNLDEKGFVEYFYSKLFNNPFQSILISGLGIGILPYICQNTTFIIDVVEIDEEMIIFTSNLGHLKSNVRIIHHDMYDYIPSMKYDIIIFDHWSYFATEHEKEYYTNKFQEFLNPNGFLYFPIIEQFRNY